MIIGTYEELEIGKIYPPPEKKDIASLTDGDCIEHKIFSFKVIRKATLEEFLDFYQEYIGHKPYITLEYKKANFYEVQMD